MIELLLLLCCRVTVAGKTATYLPRRFGLLHARFYPGLVKIGLQLIVVLFEETALGSAGSRRSSSVGAALLTADSCHIERETVSEGWGERNSLWWEPCGSPWWCTGKYGQMSARIGQVVLGVQAVIKASGAVRFRNKETERFRSKLFYVPFHSVGL